MFSSGKPIGRAVRALVPIATTAALAACAQGDQYPQTTFRPVTDFGDALNAVFYNAFWWTMGLLALVLFLTIYIVIRFRERPGAPPPKQIHGNTRLELLWTIVPAIIVMFIGIPTVRAVFSTQQRAAEDALTIEVIGHQWWWEFRYPDLGVVTANEFYVPVGRQVHLRLHSADVIHSFWVPRLGGKRDVFPRPATADGEEPRTNHIVFTADEPGVFTGQCAEYCGTAHGIMAVVAVVVPPAEFGTWVASMQEPAPAQPGAAPAQPAPAAAPTAVQGARDTVVIPTVEGGPPGVATVALPARAPLDSLARQGQQIFMTHVCIACHTIAGTSAKGMIGPNLTRFGARPTVGAGALRNTPGNVARWITNPRDVKPGAMMPGIAVGAHAPGTPPDGPPFPPTGLTAEQVRAVAAYLTSLK